MYSFFSNSIPKDTEYLFLDGNAITGFSRHSLDSNPKISSMIHDYINSEDANLKGSGFDEQTLSYASNPMIDMKNPLYKNVKMPLNDSIDILSTFYYICPAGTYNDKGYGECLVCPKGRYNDDNGSNQWKSSLLSKDGRSFYAGTLLSNHNDLQRSCVECPAGRYLDDDGKTSASHDSISDCSKCLEGKYSVITGAYLQSHCIECNEGKYANQLGMIKCKKCAVSTYQRTKGSIACLTCTTGTYQNELGSKKCKNCPRGYKGYDKSCIQCKEGRYSDKTGVLECKSCEVGQYQNNKGKGNCIKCAKGTYTGEMWENIHGKKKCDICPR